jgi:hypothetical protein
MGTILFVHGTGVRGAEYDETFARLEDGLGARKLAWHLQPCRWGDDFGVKLRAGGASIPDYATARAAGLIVEPDDEDLALWGALYADPVYELRLLTTQEAEPLAPGQEPPSAELEGLVERLQVPQELQELLIRTRLDRVWQEGIEAIIRSSEFEDALQTATPASGHPAAIARAIVAEVITRAQEQGIPLVDGPTRDEIVKLLAGALGGDQRGIWDWLRRHTKSLAMRVVTRRAARKRGAFSDVASPIAGDILLYQARGDDIRVFIRDCIQAVEPPVILLAHSLGGIACVDLLVTEPAPTVEGLITVGSQAPFLCEIDSLTGLRYGQALPNHFPRWLNLYDPNDFLSFVGGTVFAGKVEDVEIKSGQPFPESHSAYWSSYKFWDHLAKFLS